MGDKSRGPGVSQGGSLRWKVGTCIVSSPFTHKEEASAKSPGRTMARRLLGAERRGDVSPTAWRRGLGLMLCTSLNAVRAPTATQALGVVVVLGLLSVIFFGGDFRRP